ncbi:hypothetical protein [Paenibacillus sp. 2TAB19]|uniref:hypothetical protein n=1 Tax=Paenibacillus sp. 2TAB19 TaxID=3233003 RepID=UPI003F97DA5A
MRQWTITSRLAITIGTAAVLLALQFAVVSAPVEALGYASKKAQALASLTIAVHASRQAALESTLDITSAEFTKALKQSKVESAEKVVLVPDVEVKVQLSQESNPVHYRLEETGNLWREDAHTRLLLPSDSSDMLLRLAEGLRKHHYGGMTSWDSVKQTLPNKSIFAVIDLESGLSFRVQRRAGSDHADVQPLTKADTATMKQIYGGSWSWKRKAVLVQSEQGWIAASMNGMPHGGDGIPENGFSGHFCIHFLGSSTHKSEFPDLAHQLMVHKAGGELQALFDAAPPASLAKLFVVVLNHQDEHMLRQLAKEVPEEEVTKWVELMGTLVSIKEPLRKKSEGGGLHSDSSEQPALSAQVTLPITIVTKNVPERNTAYSFTFQRSAKDSPWRLIGVDN